MADGTEEQYEEQMMSTYRKKDMWKWIEGRTDRLGNCEPESTTSIWNVDRLDSSCLGIGELELCWLGGD